MNKSQKFAIGSMVFFLISVIFNAVQSPVHGLMTNEKLSEMVKEKNEQDGITPESVIEKEQDDWNKYLEAREYNRLSPYERQYLEITNNHYGTNYSSLEGASLGLYEKYLDEMAMYERQLEQLGN